MEAYPPVAIKILEPETLAADAFVTHTEILTFYFRFFRIKNNLKKARSTMSE